MTKRMILVMSLGLVSMVGAGAVGRVAAAPPAFPPKGGVPQLEEKILQAVTALQNSVQNGFTSILNALSDIQNSLDTLTAPGQSDLRLTPAALFVNPDNAYCQVVNVSTATQTVQAQLIQDDGTILVDTGKVSLAAGHALASLVAGTQPGVPTDVYCKFTVVGGSRADIRGSLSVGSAGKSVALSVPAE